MAGYYTSAPFKEWVEERRREGAAAVLGLIGMGEAIRRRKKKCPTCRCMISIASEGCSCCAEPQRDYPVKCTGCRRWMRHNAVSGGKYATRLRLAAQRQGDPPAK